ncbi:MAG: hypothetical protein ACTSR3_03120 [Candidatus Helarchaeota archaeon]
MTNKYIRNYSKNEEKKCAVCSKEITEIKDEDVNKLVYKTRIDKKLPGEKSHFKHLHVTYYFCSQKCADEFFKEYEKGFRVL